MKRIPKRLLALLLALAMSLSLLGGGAWAAELSDEAAEPDPAAQSAPEEEAPEEELPDTEEEAPDEADSAPEEPDEADSAPEEPDEADSAPEPPADARPASDGGKTLLDFLEEQEDEAPYEAHTALVMFKTGKQLTRRKVREALREQDSGIGDLEVQELYSFRQNQATAIGGGTQRYSSVCLVRSDSASTNQIIRALEQRDDVLYAEPNYRVHICDVDDSYFSRQWHMQGGAANSANYQAHTPNVSAVWESGTTGTDAIVAVVDTGVNSRHPDLKNNLWHNTHQPELAGEFGYDFIDGDGDPMDENGHGSHCAGIIGAQGNNGIGICGVNQKVRIMALRCLDENGSSWMSHEIAAYHYINQALDLGEPIRAINNSWGGGDSSSIFAQLIDLVGEKGAISCFAAGNESNNNDENPDYPSSIMSPYKLTVAATTVEGKLASFSNYGRESVDVAAPGTDILSTVSYDSYNPTIYSDSEQAELSAEYNDYESGASVWGGVEQLKANLYLNGEPYDPAEGKPAVSISSVQDGAVNREGHAAEIEVKGMQAQDLVCLTVPYDLTPDALSAPHCSLMARIAGSKDECAVFGVMDVPQGTSLDFDTISALNLGSGTMFYENSFDMWSHYTFQTIDDSAFQALLDEAPAPEDTETPNPLKREIVIVLFAHEKCDVKVHMDDFGLSRQDLTGTKAFGQYDFMSGTSMATPFITGSVALLAAEAEHSGAPLDPGVLVGKVFSMTQEGDLPVAAGGIFDFTKKPEYDRPWIGRILVDKAGGSITIRGAGLNAPGLNAELVRVDEEIMQQAEIVSQTGQELVLKDNRWINNVVNLCLTDAAGHTAKRSGRHLVEGKRTYSQESPEDSTLGGALATDGRYIYSVGKYNEGTVLKLDTRDLGQTADCLATIDPSKLFKLEKDKNAQYAMILGDDLAYLNGKLYMVVEYGKAEETEPDMSYDDNMNGVDPGQSHYSIYSGDYRLVSIDTQSGVVENLGALPAELKKTADFTLAAYNGKLLFLGGYSYESRSLTTQVKVYDPARTGNRWSDGQPLPEARAHGKALQSGSRLIYTMGWSTPLPESDSKDDFRCPANLILNGEQWTTSSVEPENSILPYYYSALEVRGDGSYPVFEGSIGAAKNGLIYTGMQAYDYGDTFVYDATADAYQDTGFQFCTDDNDQRALNSIVVGGTVYGFDGSNVYTAAAAESALIPIQVVSGTGGTVDGATEVVPGNDAIFEVNAETGYVIKSVTVDGKSIALDKNAEQKSVTISSVTEGHTVRAQFEKKRLTVTVAKGAGGTVTGASQVLYGDDAVFEAKVKTGYEIQSISVDGEKLNVKKNTAKKTIRLSNVVENHTVKVLFQKKVLSIKLTKNAGGSLTGPTKPKWGSNASIKVKAKKGYVIQSITVDKKKKRVKKNATKQTITFKKVVKNHTVKVVFRKK